MHILGFDSPLFNIDLTPCARMKWGYTSASRELTPKSDEIDQATHLMGTCQYTNPFEHVNPHSDHGLFADRLLCTFVLFLDLMSASVHQIRSPEDAAVLTDTPSRLVGVTYYLVTYSFEYAHICCHLGMSRFGR